MGKIWKLLTTPPFDMDEHDRLHGIGKYSKKKNKR